MMQSAEEFARRLRYREIEEQWDGENETYVDVGFGLSDQDAIEEVAARDAEWQAMVDTLLEDNARSEEQVKKQFANAVSFKARAEKAEARVTRLEATLEECVEYIQRTDKVNPMEALYRGEGYSKDALPLIDKICAALGRGKHEQPHLVGRR